MATNFPNIPIPSSTTQITPSWVSKVTGDVVIPEDFHIEGDIQAGFGILSSICRVSYKTNNGDTRNIIVKLLPTDPKWLEYALSDSSDEREILFYSTVLPDLLEVVPEIQENVGKFYNGTVVPADPEKGTKRASLLVMEDLNAHGFRMIDFAGDHSDHVLHGLITFMARLNFAALAVEAKKGIPLPELYPFMQGITENDEWVSQMETTSHDGYQLLEKLLTSNSISQDVLSRFKKLEPYTRTIVQKIENNGRLNQCLIHGDMWPPNIFTHDSKPVKVIDFQLLGYRDAAYDLSLMLYTVLTKEKLNTENLRRLIKRYHEEFEQLCKDKGFGDKIKRKSWEEFEEFFFTWGAAFSYMMLLPFIENFSRDYEKYANVFRVLCEETNVDEFLLRECSRQFLACS